jgi:hypothetical protein
MGEVAYGIQQDPEHITEIILHIKERLGESRRSDLVNALEETDGISSAEFCPLRYHLILVNYDRDTLNSQDVLSRVESQNIPAVLVGPV